MVAARARVHDSGIFDDAMRAVADRVDDHLVAHDTPHRVVDAGAGTGHYLAGVLARRDDLWGIGLDLSKTCARVTARAHERAVAVAADVWRPLPLVSDSVGAVLSVFSPRNAPEFARVLHPAGVLVVVTPNPDHLGEIIAPMGMLSVGADKDDRLRESLGAFFTATDEQSVHRTLRVDAPAVADLVAMGPSAFHHSAVDIESRAQALGPVDVTVSVTISTFVPVA